MPAPEWRTAGDRIQTLLDASATGGPVARERAEQLVREVVELYGAGLERVLALADSGLVDRLASDDLVASLLLVHGLHPHDVYRRVRDALDSVRPYLGSHGGDVELLTIDDGVVRLRFAGSCKSCPSSAATLELTVEDAIRAAAPEVTSVDVVAAEASPTVFSAESLLHRVHSATDWYPVPDLTELRPGEVGGFLVAGTMVLACRIGDQLFGYYDRCGACAGSLAGATLTGADLRCPRCHAGFDVEYAGKGTDGTDGHLEPIPLLMRDGVLSMATAAEPAVL